MKITYFPETDTLYIELKAGPGADAREVAPDVVLDLNASNEVIGIEIEQASKRTDLMNLGQGTIPVDMTISYAA
jgi:uncharacterized protein YuzE